MGPSASGYTAGGGGTGGGGPAPSGSIMVSEAAGGIPYCPGGDVTSGFFPLDDPSAMMFSGGGIPVWGGSAVSGIEGSSLVDVFGQSQQLPAAEWGSTRSPPRDPRLMLGGGTSASVVSFGAGAVQGQPQGGGDAPTEWWHTLRAGDEQVRGRGRAKREDLIRQDDHMNAAYPHISIDHCSILRDASVKDLQWMSTGEGDFDFF